MKRAKWQEAMTHPTDTSKPKVLTSEDLKRIGGRGHRCGYDRMPSHYQPSEGCECKCGVSYDENWNGIIDYRNSRVNGHIECKCKPPLEIHFSDGSSLPAFDLNDEEVLRHLGKMTKAELIEWMLESGDYEEWAADQACAAEERRQEP